MGGGVKFGLWRVGAVIALLYRDGKDLEELLVAALRIVERRPNSSLLLKNIRASLHLEKERKRTEGIDNGKRKR